MQCQECHYKFKLPKSTLKYANKQKDLKITCPICGGNNISW